MMMIMIFVDDDGLLNSHLHLDGRIGVISVNGKVGEFESINIGHIGVNGYRWKVPRGSLNLLLQGIHMI